MVSEEAYTPETLESIDLIVTADADQLDTFYLSASEEESDIEVESLDTTLSPRIRDQQEQQAESSVDSTQTESSSHDQQQKSVEVSDLGEKQEEEEEKKEGEKEEDAVDNEEVKSVEAAAS